MRKGTNYELSPKVPVLFLLTPGVIFCPGPSESSTGTDQDHPELPALHRRQPGSITLTFVGQKPGQEYESKAVWILHEAKQMQEGKGQGERCKREQICEQIFDITLAMNVNYLKTHTFTLLMQVVWRGPAKITNNLLTKEILGIKTLSNFSQVHQNPTACNSVVQLRSAGLGRTFYLEGQTSKRHPTGPEGNEAMN